MTVGLPSESPMMAEAVCSVLLLLLYKRDSCSACCSSHYHVWQAQLLGPTHMHLNSPNTMTGIGRHTLIPSTHAPQTAQSKVNACFVDRLSGPSAMPPPPLAARGWGWEGRGEKRCVYCPIGTSHHDDCALSALKGLSPFRTRGRRECGRVGTWDKDRDPVPHSG
jgi:hypothetical protein